MLPGPRREREEGDKLLGQRVRVWGGQFEVYREFSGNVGTVIAQVGDGLGAKRHYYYVRGLDPQNRRRTFEVYDGYMKVVEK
jgi:hypothetical protein